MNKERWVTYLYTSYFISKLPSYLSVTAILLLISFLSGVMISILRSPFAYPYKTIRIDVSKRKRVDLKEEIEKHLIANRLSEFSDHLRTVREWKQKCQAKVDKSFLRHHRERQFKESIDDSNMFVFELTRNQTRYRQSNYVRRPYKVTVVTDTFRCDFDRLNKIYESLEAIGFETTTKRYFAKNQRKNMTAKLRRQICERDNYTCQICGKHMPDGVGLQIDHIVPVSKGGKTVPSNLRVLCSKCNGAKHDRMTSQSICKDPLQPGDRKR